MAVTKVRALAVSALCLAVVLCGVGLWIVESRLAADHPGCPVVGSHRLAPALSAPAAFQRGPLVHRGPSGLGCPGGQKIRIGM